MSEARTLLRVPETDLASFEWRREAVIVASYRGDFSTTMEDVFDGLMGRDRYRRDLLTRVFDRAGVGIFREGSDLWVTLVLMGG